MKFETDFELDCGVELTLVYYITEYPEGTYIEVDWVYYSDGKEKREMNFLLDNKKFREWMDELAQEDAYNRNEI